MCIPPGLLDGEFVLGMFSPEETGARKAFREFHEKMANDHCLKPFGKESQRLTDEEARMEIVRVLNTVSLPQVKSLPREERNVLLKKIKRIEGVSQRQAARILGVSPNLLFRLEWNCLCPYSIHCVYVV